MEHHGLFFFRIADPAMPDTKRISTHEAMLDKFNQLQVCGIVGFEVNRDGGEPWMLTCSYDVALQ